MPVAGGAEPAPPAASAAPAASGVVDVDLEPEPDGLDAEGLLQERAPAVSPRPPETDPVPLGPWVRELVVSDAAAAAEDEDTDLSGGEFADSPVDEDGPAEPGTEHAGFTDPTTSEASEDLVTIEISDANRALIEARIVANFRRD